MSERAEKAVEAAHAAICEDSLSDCLDLDWGGGKCYRAVHAALPHLTAQDVPHLIRQAKAEAWDEGYRASGIVYPTLPPKHPTNPYAEEATDDHA